MNLANTSLTLQQNYFVALDYDRGILAPVLVIAVHLFLYGFYVSLFRFEVLALAKRKNAQGYLLHLVSAATTFVLATISVPISMGSDILSLSVSYWVVSGPGSEATILEANIARGALEICRLVIIVLISTIADTMLIYRFFAIWGEKRKGFAVILFVSCATLNGEISTLAIVEYPLKKFLSTGLGACSAIWMTVPRTPFHGRTINVPAIDRQLHILFLVSAASHIFVNLALTIMIAGRILWVARIASRAQEPESTRFRMIVAIIIESGLLYVAGCAGFLVGMRTGVNMESIFIQVAAIAPTLLIVRTNMENASNADEVLQSQGSLAALTSIEDQTLVLESVRQDSVHPPA
ncbi:hypothetical protein PQX77_013354 [Marasmius sp. AFHP31]|nr:hypothetical protein PQX77_013354 [Marasmius sp. AFHP31]